MWWQQVRRGRYKNEVDVAVKMMKEGSMQEADFIDEAKTMMYLLSSLFLPYSAVAECSICYNHSVCFHPILSQYPFSFQTKPVLNRNTM